MEISHPAIAFQDDRGRIIDVMESLDFNSATVISTRKGAVRGNHYHQKTTQWIYVLRGKVLAHSRVPDGPLRTIPFGALHDGKQFLINRFAFATTPGLTLTDPHPLPNSTRDGNACSRPANRWRASR